MRIVKHTYIILSVAILLICKISFSQAMAKDSVNIITSDITLFWKAFDESKPKLKKVYFDEYIESGTVGLKDFMSRIGSAKKLAKTVKKRKDDYLKVRESSHTVERDYKDKIAKALFKLKEVYPTTIFPDIYFVIGRFNAGGIPSKNGIIIGYELFSEIGMQNIVPLVTHESIHFQQNYNRENWNLLKQCITEGSADFLSLLIREEPLKHHNDAWGLENEAALWEQFEKDMNNNTFGGWLYGGSAIKNSPGDMGYWIGHRITKAYYERATDKEKAIHDILNIKDFNRFLNQSGYAEKFK